MLSDRRVGQAPLVAPMGKNPEAKLGVKMPHPPLWNHEKTLKTELCMSKDGKTIQAARGAGLFFNALE